MNLDQELKYRFDLASGTSVVNLASPLVEGDEDAQTFRIELLDGGDPAKLTNTTCSGYFMRAKTKEAEADTIPISGAVSGNTATLTLTESCYSRSCYFSLAIRLTSTDEQKRTIMIVRGVVVKSIDGTLIDPDGSIPTVDEIFAQIAAMERSRQDAEEATEEALAAAARADEAREGIQGDLAALSEEIDATAPMMMARNILADQTGWQTGYYVNYGDGVLSPLDGYTATDYIHVGNAGMVEVGRGVGMFAFFNANKEFMWPGVGIESPDHIQPQHYIIPEGAAYVRFSLLDTLKDNAYAYLLNDDTGPVFYVGQFGNTVAIDGVQQHYDKVTDAVIEAVKYRNSTVYIADGNYDILAELGEEYLSQTFSDTVRGIELRNNIRIVGTPRAYLIANYDGDNASARGYFSIFNISGSAHIENVNFVGKNIRYCIHDETGYMTIPHCHTSYKKCYFTLDNTENDQCQAICGIGAGLGYHNTLEIEDCYFDSPVTIVGYPDIYIHNHAQPNSRSRIVVKGNYCANSTIRITYYGASPEISTAIVTNNSTARPVEFAAETPDSTILNVDCVMWNNVTH